MERAKEKRLFRKKLREEVKALGQEYCKSADKSIRDQVVSMPEYQRAGTIFCFVGRQDEINTMPLILDALFQGKRVGVPKCVAEGIMEVRRITGKEDLEPGSYGILEPKKGTGLIGPEEIDLSLIPCLSCSPDGRRLGYGGGYYDRYLREAAGAKAVLCRKRLMREDIPVEEHDMRIGLVVNEDGIIR